MRRHVWVLVRMDSGLDYAAPIVDSDGVFLSFSSKKAAQIYARNVCGGEIEILKLGR